MPRRRLHGETQKRRKKPRTRALKRAVSADRVQTTQQPAPFERSEQVERDDLEFLEAMRELDVRRGPWSGASKARRLAVERVQFLAEDGERALFLRGMEHMGVQPLADPVVGESTDGASASGSITDTIGATGTTAPVPAAPRERDGLPAGPWPDSAPPSAPASDSAAAAGNRTTGAIEHSAVHAATVHATTVQATVVEETAAEEQDGVPGTRFESGPDDAALMRSLLREGDAAPALKFADATPGDPAIRRRGTQQRPAWEQDDLDPDSDLDLHGKTLEEAIRMVQNFLQVSHAQRLRHVLIITGRGHNSGSAGPVLKDAVFRWIELNGQRFARGFGRAPARHGGDGAIWVHLR